VVAQTSSGSGAARRRRRRDLHVGCLSAVTDSGLFIRTQTRRGGVVQLGGRGMTRAASGGAVMRKRRRPIPTIVVVLAVAAAALAGCTGHSGSPVGIGDSPAGPSMDVVTTAPGPTPPSYRSPTQWPRTETARTLPGGPGTDRGRQPRGGGRRARKTGSRTSRAPTAVTPATLRVLRYLVPVVWKTTGQERNGPAANARLDIRPRHRQVPPHLLRHTIKMMRSRG
jgi:hypothetical protein